MHRTERVVAALALEGRLLFQALDFEFLCGSLALFAVVFIDKPIRMRCLQGPELRLQFISSVLIQLCLADRALAGSALHNLLNKALQADAVPLLAIFADKWILLIYFGATDPTFAHLQLELRLSRWQRFLHLILHN